jgi:nuclear pore complex protein Nup205
MLIYDNQTWLPVASLFGLIGCPILRELKTQIFLLLAAFAKTPDIAAVMWNTLENSQVLSTSMSFVGGATTPQYGLGNVQHEGSIQIELEEIETAAEEYSETRAFLALLDSLIDSCPLPLSLGINHRIPGFQPYLDFVQDVVLLKFDSRGYKDPQEKWLVASSSLNILHKLLLNHELSVNDLIEQHYEISPKSFVPLPQQPGFLILLHLLNDSPLLRKVLFIVDECCLLLSDIESSTDEVAAAGLQGLKMIETVLAKQDEFLHHLRSNSAHSLMATPINEFLLGINPRTGKADYYITISR